MKDAEADDWEKQLDDMLKVLNARMDAIGIPEPKNPLQSFIRTLEILEDLRLTTGANTLDVPPEADILSPLCQHFFGEFTTWPNISSQGRLIMAIFTDHIGNSEGLNSLIDRPAWALNDRQNKILEAAMKLKTAHPKWTQENIAAELESVAELNWAESSRQRGLGNTARRELGRINERLMSALTWDHTPIKVKEKYKDCVRTLFRNSAKQIDSD